jgi:hypothetical protein
MLLSYFARAYLVTYITCHILQSVIYCNTYARRIASNSILIFAHLFGTTLIVLIDTFLQNERSGERS